MNIISRSIQVIYILFLLTSAMGCRAVQSLSDSGLRDAACKGDFSQVKSQIRRGANVNAKDESGNTALLYAESCSMPSTPSNPEIGLLSSEAIVQVLLENGAEVNVQDEKGRTALMYAAQNGHVESIKALIAKGGKVNVRDKEGQTALMEAARLGCSADALKILIKAGADTAARNNKGESVLAQAKCNSAMAQILMDSGAK